MSVCLCVCLFAYLKSKKPHNHTSKNVLYVLTMVMAWSFCDDNAIRHLLPIFWMTSCFDYYTTITTRVTGIVTWLGSSSPATWWMALKKWTVHHGWTVMSLSALFVLFHHFLLVTVHFDCEYWYMYLHYPELLLSVTILWVRSSWV